MKSPIFRRLKRGKVSAIPYPVLLGFQAGVLAVLIVVLWRVNTNAISPHPWKHQACFALGGVYFAVMAFPLGRRPDIPDGIRMVRQERTSPVSHYTGIADTGIWPLPADAGQPEGERIGLACAAARSRLLRCLQFRASKKRGHELLNGENFKAGRSQARTQWSLSWGSRCT